jgi:sterol 14-demethylase
MFVQLLQGIYNSPASVTLAVAGVLVAWAVVQPLLALKKGVPSVAAGLPIVGNLILYSKDPVSFIDRATRQYGHCFAVPMLLGRTVWLRSPQLNKEYLETREVRKPAKKRHISADDLPLTKLQDVWSFGDGMGMFLNKLLVPGYFDHLRAFVGSLSRGTTRQATLEHYGQIAREETLKTIKELSPSVGHGKETELFEEVSFLVHKIIVRCLMGQDFYDHHVKELFDLLHAMEANVGSILHTILPSWVPHKPARELWAARDRVREIFDQRLRERELHPDVWKEAPDYIAYTLRDSATAHLTSFYGAHHTLLMFAAHTSTVASISWTIVEVRSSFIFFYLPFSRETN